MNSENSKPCEPYVLMLSSTDKLDLRRGAKRIYYTWKNLKCSYNNNKLKISASIWNDKLELPDGSYFLSDIQEYFVYLLTLFRMGFFEAANG